MIFTMIWAPVLMRKPRQTFVLSDCVKHAVKLISFTLFSKLKSLFSNLITLVQNPLSVEVEFVVLFILSFRSGYYYLFDCADFYCLV